MRTLVYAGPEADLYWNIVESASSRGNTYHLGRYHTYVWF
jgi:hypothetical protein